MLYKFVVASAGNLQPAEQSKQAAGRTCIRRGMAVHVIMSIIEEDAEGAEGADEGSEKRLINSNSN